MLALCIKNTHTKLQEDPIMPRILFSLIPTGHSQQAVIGGAQMHAYGCFQAAD